MSRDFNQIKMETNNRNLNAKKQRHGCVTTWLILMIIINSLSSIIYFFASDFVVESLSGDVSTPMIVLLGIIGIANVVFSVLLLQWKKNGFWGFIVTSIAALIINLYLGLGIGQSVFGMVGMAILYGVLQMKKNDVTAWDNLE